MLDQFLNHIRQYQLCSATDLILLAVSGGKDSMAMLHLYKEAGFKVGVAHVNFQLRGEDSVGDEEFVKNACHKLGMPFYSTRVETKIYAMERGLSTQMAARELRYAWFDRLITNHQYQYVATAHHLNDSIETVLLNLIKGSSLESLTGIPVKNGNRIRPLLFATQSQIEKYVSDKSIAWREDISNQSDNYQRNFIRHHVVPLLKKVNPSLENTFKAGTQKLNGEAELMSLGLLSMQKTIETTKGNQLQIPKNILNPIQNKASVLWAMIRAFNFNLDQANSIVEVIETQSGKRFLSSTHQLVVDREYLIINTIQPMPEEVIIGEDQYSAQSGWLTMTIKVVSEMDLNRNQKEALLDLSRLKFPLIWRKWKPGDFFYPLGMDHKRKVSDFLIDEKVSIIDKESVTVLESDGQVCWVVGYRIDNRFKITAETSRSVLFLVHW